MKLGILTFACAYNYGAMLQCYALQQTLRKLGHEVEVINYRPKYLETEFPYGFTPLRRLILTIRHIITMRIPFRVHNFKRFANFEKEYYQLSATACHNAQEYSSLIAKYYAIVIGSDQVWNNRWNGTDPVWYGWHKGENGDNAPAFITYAASAGAADFNTEEDALFTKYVSHFKKLLVREECLQTALKKRYNLDSQVVLDPTLLANTDTWTQWKEIKPVEGDYVLIYQGRDDDNALRIAEKIASDNNWRVICTDLYVNAKKRGIKRVLVSPNEFVGLVNHAKCVVTTSFHGTAFSLICHSPFYYVRLCDGMDERTESILAKVGLTSRLIEKDWNGTLEDIDFKSADEILCTKREEDCNLLREALCI